MEDLAMTDEQNTSNHEDSQSAQEEGWQEVGRQFQTLGESLAAAMRSAWENEGNHKRLDEMHNGLASMVDQVGQAIKDTASSPQAQQAKVEAEKAVNSFSNAVEQGAQEVRPQLISALRQVNTELQKLIDRLKTG
jgi:ABC-type transporter Mla subunit MlaD